MEYVNGEPIGLGVFADQSITRGTVLLHGKFGQNVLLFNQYDNLPQLKNPATAEYLRDYGGNCPCMKHMLAFMPGISCNHSNNPNILMVPVKDGADLMAIRDIKKGEALNSDYRTYGIAPKWFVNMLQEETGDTKCMYPGYNDYVPYNITK